MAGARYKRIQAHNIEHLLAVTPEFSFFKDIPDQNPSRNDVLMITGRLNSGT